MVLTFASFLIISNGNNQVFYLRHMSDLNAKLDQHGLRPTKQRLQLAELLFSGGQPRHFTADELFEEARRAGHQISLATIYNSLNAFSQAGMIREISVEGQRSFYDTNTDAHPHFLNVTTGEVFDADAGSIEVVYHGRPPDGMVVTGIDVVLRVAPKKSH